MGRLAVEVLVMRRWRRRPHTGVIILDVGWLSDGEVRGLADAMLGLLDRGDLAAEVTRAALRLNAGLRRVLRARAARELGADRAAELEEIGRAVLGGHGGD